MAASQLKCPATPVQVKSPREINERALRGQSVRARESRRKLDEKFSAQRPASHTDLPGAVVEPSVSRESTASVSSNLLSPSILTPAKDYLNTHHPQLLQKFIRNLFGFFNFSLDAGDGLEKFDDEVVKGYFECHPHYQNDADIKALLLAIINLANDWRQLENAENMTADISLELWQKCIEAKSKTAQGHVYGSIEEAFCGYAGQLLRQAYAIEHRIKIEAQGRRLRADEEQLIADVFREYIEKSFRDEVALTPPRDRPIRRRLSSTNVARFRQPNFDDDHLNEVIVLAPPPLPEVKKPTEEPIITKILQPLDQAILDATSNGYIEEKSCLKKDLTTLRHDLKLGLKKGIKEGKSEQELETSNQAECAKDTAHVLRKTFSSDPLQEKPATISAYYYKHNDSCGKIVGKVVGCITLGLASIVAGALFGVFMGAVSGLLTGGYAAVPAFTWGMLTGASYVFKTLAAFQTLSAAFGYLGVIATNTVFTAPAVYYGLFKKTAINQGTRRVTNQLRCHVASQIQPAAQSRLGGLRAAH